MKLFHCRDSRSTRPLWALEEMGFAYDLEILRFPPQVLQKEYLGLNPLGTVPFFVDGETRIAESVAICQYLVDRYRRDDFGLLPDHPEYGAHLNWLHHADATLTFPLAVVMRYRHVEPPRVGCSKRQRTTELFFLGRLKLLNVHLRSHLYLCAERFTIADICVGFALHFGASPHIDMAEAYQPQVRDYLARLRERPAFQRAAFQGPVYLPDEPGTSPAVHRENNWKKEGEQQRTLPACANGLR